MNPKSIHLVQAAHDISLLSGVRIRVRRGHVINYRSQILQIIRCHGYVVTESSCSLSLDSGVSCNCRCIMVLLTLASRGEWPRDGQPFCQIGCASCGGCGATWSSGRSAHSAAVRSSATYRRGLTVLTAGLGLRAVRILLCRLAESLVLLCSVRLLVRLLGGSVLLLGYRAV